MGRGLDSGRANADRVQRSLSVTIDDPLSALIEELIRADKGTRGIDIDRNA